MPTEPTAREVLIQAARQEAARRLGRARLPVRVVVVLDALGDVDAVAVELVDGGPATEGRVTECLRDVIAALARAGKRLTTTEVMTALDRQGTPHGEGPVKQTLAAAVRDGLIVNAASQDRGKPSGYGLPGPA
jgi:hypothetical protein